MADPAPDPDAAPLTRGEFKQILVELQAEENQKQQAAQQAAAALQTGSAMAQGAQTLSQTPTNGGQSTALDDMMGRAA